MQQVIDFISTHQVVMAALLVAILDLCFALIPRWNGNGLLHSIYACFKNIADRKTCLFCGAPKPEKPSDQPMVTPSSVPVKPDPCGACGGSGTKPAA